MAVFVLLLLLLALDATAAAVHRKPRVSALTTAKEQRSSFSDAPPDYHH